MTDRDEIVRHDWQAFSELETMTDHWTRPAWPDGARAYYWLLPLGDSQSLRDAADACQKSLSSLGDLDPVPLDLLHLTVCRVGDADLDARALSSVADRAAEQLSAQTPIRLSVGPLAGSAGAVRFTVSPWAELLHLQQQLVEVKNEVLASSPNRGFRPHISIAYNARPRKASEVLERVRQLHDLLPVDLTVSTIELVKLTRDGRVYRWQTLRTIAFDQH